MTEDEARRWLDAELGVSRETKEKLEAFIGLLRSEMQRQNLISKSSAEEIWTRHIVDSAQLLHFADAGKGNKLWLDLGTGAGFPGIVIAIFGGFHVKMVESRKRRVEFLQNVIERLELHHSEVIGERLERAETFEADVISARAFAPLDRLLTISSRFSTEKTLWLLPKGRNAARELQSAPAKWRNLFHVEHSLTDPEAGILVGRGRARTKK